VVQVTTKQSVKLASKRQPSSGRAPRPRPAYAATIHKSQGSEYPAVIIPLLTQHYAMLQRNLLYTGVTQGKRLVVLVGQKKAIAIAVLLHRPCDCFLIARTTTG